jgi:hypothetical protein
LPTVDQFSLAVDSCRQTSETSLLLSPKRQQ